MTLSTQEPRPAETADAAAAAAAGEEAARTSSSGRAVASAHEPSDTPAVAPAVAPKPRQPLRRSAADMARSMAVVVGIVVVLVLLVPRPNEVVQPNVNVASAAAGARPGLQFEPSVPVGLPAGWSARSATAQRGTDGVVMWRLNYSTPSKRFAGVSQAAAPSDGWEDRQVTDGREQGTIDVAGLPWVVRSRTDRGITSWVLRQPGLTTVVTGTAPQQELTALAASLRLPERPATG